MKMIVIPNFSEVKNTKKIIYFAMKKGAATAIRRHGLRVFNTKRGTGPIKPVNKRYFA